MKYKLGLVALICSVILANFWYSRSKNNVCATYWDYFFIHSSENCWYTQDHVAEVPQIILQRNFTLETYHTVTEDGYILTTFRILPKTKSKGLIFLEHSFIANSEMWIDKGDLSLGIYLLERGYEVWLGNLRGSKYSNTHMKYTTDDLEYWDWSFHEQAVFDIRSQLQLVSKITGRNDIIFISYSMAGTSSIIYSSLFPEEAKNLVKLFIGIGGLTYTKNMRGTVDLYLFLFKNLKLKDIMDYFSVGYLPYGSIFKTLSKLVCLSHPFKPLCVFGILPMIGYTHEFDPSVVPIVFAKIPDAASTKCLHHYLQNYDRGEFRMYDYGVKKNLELYNSTVPPKYPIQNMKVPYYLIHGTQDYFAHPKDVEAFYEDLPPEAKKYGHELIEGYNHMDVMYGIGREEKVNKKILKLLDTVK